MRILFFLLSSLTWYCVPVPGSPADETANKESLPGRLDAWRAWSESFDHWTVTIETQLSDEPGVVGRRRIQRDKQLYCMRLEHKQGQTTDLYLSLANAEYVAELQGGLNGQWALTSLTMVNAPKYDKARDDVVRGTDYFFRDMMTPGDFVERLLKHETYSVTSVENTVDSIVYNLLFIPRDPKPDTGWSALTSMRLHFSSGDVAPPIRIDYSYAETKVSLVFSEWVKAAGKDVAGKIFLYKPQFAGPGIEPLMTTTITTDEMDVPLDPTTCYLNHYGLPEPAGGTESDMPFWGLIAIGCVIAFGGFLLMRHRRTH